VSLLRSLFGLGQPAGSGTVAKERLKVVLEYDRSQLSPAQMDQIREEIITILSNHVNVRREDVQVKLETGGRLVVNVPLERGRRGST
jgi:cell division topological specificity factor